MALTMLMDNNKNEKLNRNTHTHSYTRRYAEKEIYKTKREKGERGYWYMCGDKTQKIGIQTNQAASICPCSL